MYQVNAAGEFIQVEARKMLTSSKKECALAHSRAEGGCFGNHLLLRDCALTVERFIS